MDYRYIVALSLQELESQVTPLLNVGYELDGGAQLEPLGAVNERGELPVRFTQALVKKSA
ncbi:DUF1737 domain-containing protein [Formicincola oecophyllae]|uniref:DUF1737 domain-containing protein n=1 Tax=Formicincola oecophyllae TaxID=2558361 RepID=A0A4Y6U7M5_9PROT|nr:DUF1737 domain-containing protein [Formicincola oecophyllae]QDH13409.1 DUF1737 domain-containing protein [Formicincola oecophyllae]